MSVAEIEKMTSAERLETMERLWDAISHDINSPESPSWHEEVLKQRREKIDSGEAKFYTLEEVKTQFS